MGVGDTLNQSSKLYPRPIGLLSARRLLPTDAVALMGSAREGLKEDRQLIDYLRSGAIVFAIMEYTQDVIGETFGVSGGSAIQTDGSYYWRTDAADYVGAYGIAPSDEFILHVATNKICPRIDQKRLLEIDSALYRAITEGADPARDEP